MSSAAAGEMRWGRQVHSPGTKRSGSPGKLSKSERMAKEREVAVRTAPHHRQCSVHSAVGEP